MNLLYNVRMPNTRGLIEFLNNNIPPRQGRRTAIALEITPSHLGEILHGRSRPSPELCQRMAAYFGLSETQVLQMAGYIKKQKIDDQVEQLIDACAARLRRDPDLREIVRIYLATRSLAARKRLRAIVLAAASEHGADSG